MRRYILLFSFLCSLMLCGCFDTKPSDRYSGPYIDSLHLIQKIKSIAPEEERQYEWNVVCEDLNKDKAMDMFVLVTNKDSFVSSYFACVDTVAQLYMDSGKVERDDILTYKSKGAGFVAVNLTKGEHRCANIFNYSNKKVVRTEMDSFFVEKMEENILWCHLYKTDDRTGLKEIYHVPFYIEKGVMNSCRTTRVDDISHYFGSERFLDFIAKQDGGEYLYSVMQDIPGDGSYMYINYKINNPKEGEFYYYVKCFARYHYLKPIYDAELEDDMVTCRGTYKVDFFND